METPGMERRAERRSLPRTITPLSTTAPYGGESLLRFPLKAPELQRRLASTGLARAAEFSKAQVLPLWTELFDQLDRERA